MEFYSPGKILLTGEYLVLEGVKGLALPTQKGQKIRFTPTPENKVVWKSYTEDNQCWVDCTFSLDGKLKDAKHTHPSVVHQLEQLFNIMQRLAPQKFPSGFCIESFLEFPQNWGLGSSSTFVHNLAQWLAINPYELLDLTMGGSGYDIAVAQHGCPLFYERDKYHPKIEKVEFQPSFSENLFFVHLNEKRKSSDAIAGFSKKKKASSDTKKRIAEIGERICQSNNQKEFEDLLKEHEDLLSSLLGEASVQKRLFADFEGQLKSLGAWGGDFILASGNASTPAYFDAKGYTTVIPFSDFIKS